MGPLADQWNCNLRQRQLDIDRTAHPHLWHIKPTCLCMHPYKSFNSSHKSLASLPSFSHSQSFHLPFSHSVTPSVPFKSHWPFCSLASYSQLPTRGECQCLQLQKIAYLQLEKTDSNIQRETMKTVYTDATFKAFDSIYHVLNGKRNVSMNFITLCLIIRQQKHFGCFAELYINITYTQICNFWQGSWITETGLRRKEVPSYIFHI